MPGGIAGALGEERGFFGLLRLSPVRLYPGPDPGCPGKYCATGAGPGKPWGLGIRDRPEAALPGEKPAYRPQMSQVPERTGDTRGQNGGIPGLLRLPQMQIYPEFHP